MKRLAPVWAFAANRSRKAARLGAEVRSLRHTLAVVTAERDRARTIAAILAPDDEAWTAEDEAFLRSLGERPA